MSLEGIYDQNNVFAKIVREDIPSIRVYEDAATLAFMDAFPQSRGHCLVILKSVPARNLLEAPPESLAPLISTVQKVARAVRAALRPDGVVISQFNGQAAGQTVFHLHFHIIPRWSGEALASHGQSTGDPGELSRIAAQIAAEIER